MRLTTQSKQTGLTSELSGRWLDSEGELRWQTQTGKALTFTYLSEVNAFGSPSNCTIGGTVIAG